MSYQVLALKYRPQTFDEIIGQEAITQTLQNAVSQQRLHHAYLFAGPRGIGKTSLARIFAKSLNCEQGPTITPCQKCVSCIEITEGRSLDVQEIDGASHTSVDDIRTLRENVKYSPGTGGYRIYIIDEVHMLSKSAFAALLKTLEEPPDHVIFLFATTDPEKIPATIHSRVLRFDYRRPGVKLLVDHLQKITKKEKVSIDREGLTWIARAAEESVRDSLSLLDRVISFAGNKVSAEQVLQVLGVTGRAVVMQLVQQVLERDTAAALKRVQELFEEGIDLKQFGQEFLEAIRDLLYFKIVGKDGCADWSQSEIESVAAIAATAKATDLEFMFHLFYRAYQEMVRSPLPKVLLEIAVLRLCTRAEREAIGALLERLEGSPPPYKGGGRGEVSLGDQGNTTFAGFLKLVETKKPSLAPILARAGWGGEVDGAVRLFYPPNQVHAEMLRDADRQALVLALGKEYFKKDIVWETPEAKVTPPVQAGDTKVGDSIVDDAVSIFQPRQTEVI